MSTQQSQRELNLMKFLDITVEEFQQKLNELSQEEVDRWSDLPIGNSIVELLSENCNAQLYVQGIAATCDALLEEAVHTFSRKAD